MEELDHQGTLRHTDEKAVAWLVAQVSNGGAVAVDVAPADLNLWLGGYQAAARQRSGGHLTAPKPRPAAECAIPTAHDRLIDLHGEVQRGRTEDPSAD